MLTVYDVHLELCADATIADVAKLKNHFKALRINAIGLDRDDVKAPADEISFTIFADFGPFMMKKVIQECTDSIFPGSIVELAQNG